MKPLGVRNPPVEIFGSCGGRVEQTVAAREIIFCHSAYALMQR